MSKQQQYTATVRMSRPNPAQWFGFDEVCRFVGVTAADGRAAERAARALAAVSWPEWSVEAVFNVYPTDPQGEQRERP